MRDIVGLLLVLIFVMLALLHIYWAVGGDWGKAASVPTVSGKALFRPSRVATLLVAAALLVASMVIAGAMGWIGAGPSKMFTLLTFAMSAVFLLRAIGDFKHAGFFKAASDSPFAYWDTRLYSPLCLFIAASAFFVAWRKA